MKTQGLKQQAAAASRSARTASISDLLPLAMILSTQPRTVSAKPPVSFSSLSGSSSAFSGISVSVMNVLRTKRHIPGTITILEFIVPMFSSTAHMRLIQGSACLRRPSTQQMGWTCRKSIEACGQLLKGQCRVAHDRLCAPEGEVLGGHLGGVVGRPGRVAPHGGAAHGQHADAGAPGPEQAHALVLRHQIVAEEGADEAQLRRVACLPCTSSVTSPLCSI